MKTLKLKEKFYFVKLKTFKIMLTKNFFKVKQWKKNIYKLTREKVQFRYIFIVQKTGYYCKKCFLKKQCYKVFD